MPLSFTTIQFVIDPYLRHKTFNWLLLCTMFAILGLCPVSSHTCESLLLFAQGLSSILNAPDEAAAAASGSTGWYWPFGLGTPGQILLVLQLMISKTVIVHDTGYGCSRLCTPLSSPLYNQWDLRTNIVCSSRLHGLDRLQIQFSYSLRFQHLGSNVRSNWLNRGFLV